VDRIALVACSKTKLPDPAPARDLYRGTLFRAARAWAETRCAAWWILSARHGLLAPDQVIAPYDDALDARSAQQRREWSWKVFHQVVRARDRGLFPAPGDPHEIVFLTGYTYRRYLASDLLVAGYRLSFPLAGLPYGRQVARLKEMRQEATP
jgi:hypothetical protein